MKTPESATDNNVVRKTPEEIKADAAICLTKPPHSMCDRFDLNKKCKGDCGYVIKELYDLVLHYESHLAQVERERDAALDTLHDICSFCKGRCLEISGGYLPPDCKRCMIKNYSPKNTKEATQHESAIPQDMPVLRRRG